MKSWCGCAMLVLAGLEVRAEPLLEAHLDADMFRAMVTQTQIDDWWQDPAIRKARETWRLGFQHRRDSLTSLTVEALSHPLSGEISLFAMGSSDAGRGAHPIFTCTEREVADLLTPLWAAILGADASPGAPAIVRIGERFAVAADSLTRAEIASAVSTSAESGAPPGSFFHLKVHGSRIAGNPGLLGGTPTPLSLLTDRDQLEEIMLSVGFRDGGVQTDFVVLTGEAPEGLMALLENTDDWGTLRFGASQSQSLVGFNMVPPAEAFRLIDGLFEQSSAAEDWRASLDRIDTALGVSLSEDILPAFGSQQVFFVAPSIGMMPSPVWAVRVDEPARAEETLITALSSLASGESRFALGNQSMGARRYHTLRFAAMPYPICWVVEDNHLLVGLGPYALQGALSAAEAGETVADRALIADAVRRAGGNVAILSLSIPPAASNLDAMQLAALASLSDTSSPDHAQRMIQSTMNALPATLRHSGASVTTVRREPAGIHLRTFNTTGVWSASAGSGMLMATAVPAFIRAREEARARACQENLGKIEAATVQCSLDFRLDEEAPVPLGDLVGETRYLRQMPRCPAGGAYPETLHVGVPPTCSIGTDNAPFSPHVVPRPNPWLAQQAD